MTPSKLLTRVRPRPGTDPASDDLPVVVERAVLPAAEQRPVRPARPPRPVPPSLGLTVWVLGVLSALALWFVGYVIVVGAVSEQRSQNELYSKLRGQLSAATAPLGPTDPGTAMAVLRAPRGILDDVVVVEGTTSGDLQAGPGHRRDTAFPGQAGVSVVMGKAGTFGGPFRRVTGLRVGDVITATTGQGEFRYRIDRVRRAGDPLPPVLGEGKGRLTLVTAEASGWLSRLTPHSVVYVDATLVGDVQPAPPGRPGRVPDSETAMGTSADALVPLVLWLQALVLIAVGVVWAQVRWGAWQTWLVASPVLVAALVGASAATARLLPNLL